MVSDIEVSLSRLSCSVITDSAELSVSEGDLASQFLLLSESFSDLSSGLLFFFLFKQNFKMFDGNIHLI